MFSISHMTPNFIGLAHFITKIQSEGLKQLFLYLLYFHVFAGTIASLSKESISHIKCTLWCCGTILLYTVKMCCFHWFNKEVNG